MAMKLSLAPISCYWPRQRVFDFYADIVDSPVDIVYLGETVCSKRRELASEDWLEIAGVLESAGKEVVLSSLGLIMSGSELGALKTLCDTSSWRVEANDLSAVQLLAAKALPFVCGSSLNVYNARSARILAERGAFRWQPPVELSRDALAGVVAEMETAMQTEVLAYGRMPLACSARCFTARHHDLPKDDCQYKCLAYPEGLLLRSQDSDEVFNINGIQTQSSRVYNLIGEIDDMKSMGVDICRVSPRAQGTVEILKRFHHVIHGTGAPSPLLEVECNGYWYARPGMEQIFRERNEWNEIPH